LQHVAQAGRVRRAPGKQVFLVDQWNDGARDQVPLRADGERHHRLDVEHRLFALLRRAEVAVHVELERQADEVGDRVLRLSRELFLASGEHGKRIESEQ